MGSGSLQVIEGLVHLLDCGFSGTMLVSPEAVTTVQMAATGHKEEHSIRVFMDDPGEGTTEGLTHWIGYIILEGR